MGAIYGIGVGPGDPALLTLRAAEVLQRVSAVMAPRATREGGSLALSIARPHLPASCAVLEAVFPMTEERAVLEQAWQDAAAALLARARQGEAVAFLTLGDALLYSTWSYLLRAIRRQDAEIEVVTIPGITAMSACAAAVNRPLAEGRAPLLVWPDAPPTDLAPLLEIAPNLVFMKAARHLRRLADMAEARGAAAVAVQRCTLPEQRVIGDLRDDPGRPDYFTTVLLQAEGGR
ncbi:MAG TPA: precorrin-2 C(20)-methyltransferase [Armatimonadota bacterium]|nr:precorrin-2 C(20)-methyltransferase [Armatimonadota bacterium]HOS42844.1 precorrin-2 C(20)-methyltransferase [Armatimonadota bacterium]